MPALYRSKSFRRLEETNNRLTDFLEKDNIKVLATAAAQLFISTPHLDKWFKSSTGTICFLKDFTRKCSYYFRLYSLMQGQLWEQEMESPFSYQKASYLFHYLTVNRFNYGFKFICEDEAERFYSCISKYASESSEHKNQTNMDTNQLSSTRTIRLSRRNLSANVCGSYLNTNPINSSTQTVNSSIHKSRRNVYSIDRKRKIEKSDISCPFRCSRVDLDNPDEINQQQIGQASADSMNSLNINQKYSTIVKRALSSASSTSTSTTKQIINRTSVETSLNLNRVVSNSASNSSLNSTYSSPNSVNTSPELTRLNKNLETLKEILIEYNLPINKNLIKLIKDYIKNKYGCIDKFKKSLNNEEDKAIFNMFVAASSAALIGSKNQQKNQQNDSPSKLNRFQTVYPNTPPSPLVSKLNNKPSAITTTPTTPVGSQTNSRINYSNYQPMTPYSIISRNNSLTHQQQQQQQQHSERTPIRTNPLISTANMTRSSTPSPLRHQFLNNNSNMVNNTNKLQNTPNSVSIDSNAPPKPPRRSSLKVIN